jgi:hypothetical protein
MKFFYTILASTTLSLNLSAQTVPVSIPPTGAETATLTAPATKPEPLTMPKELLEKVKKENDEAVKRIAEIDATVYPIQEDIAQKLFGLRVGEYTFLRMQTQAPQVASQYFEKLKNSDSNSFEGMAVYFDETFEALQAGEFWVGREGGLVQEDVSLFKELQAKVLVEQAKRLDGEKLNRMMAEREILLTKLKTSQPLFKYFSERRQWWRNHPDYESVVKKDNVVVSPE